MMSQAISLLPTQVNLGPSRLNPQVVEKINELVARGVTDIYQVKHGIINYVEKDLFIGVDKPIPARHNKSYFPTITDLQNHIHQAMLALESGTLESLPPVRGLIDIETLNVPTAIGLSFKTHSIKGTLTMTLIFSLLD